MEQLFDWIGTNMSLVILILGVSQVLFFVFVILLIIRIARSTRPYRRMSKELQEGPLELTLGNYLKKVNSALEQVNHMEGICRKLEQKAAKFISRVSLVRFNAFEDVGSDLSFTVAFLDGHGDGVVLTSIYGRNESRPYAKLVRQGKSPYNLSEEEEEAIRQALDS